MGLRMRLSYPKRKGEGMNASHCNVTKLSENEVLGNVSEVNAEEKGQGS